MIFVQWTLPAARLEFANRRITMVATIFEDMEKGSTTSYNPNIRQGAITRESSPTFTSSSGSSSADSSEKTVNFDPETQAALDTIIKELMGGGTKEQKKDRVQRNALMGYVQQLLGQYTKEAAFADADKLMKLNLQQSAEKNMPAIARSIEGAGTSAAAMQGLLSQKLVNDSALSAGALGAEQAKSYAGATVNLTSLLEALSRPDNSIVNSLLGALQTAKGGTTTRSLSQSGTSNQSGFTSGKTEVTTMDAGGPSSSSDLLSIGPNRSGGNSLMDTAVRTGYSGDLRDIASYSNSGQTIFDYTAPYRD